MKFLVTGGAGFIGSAVVRHLINDYQFEVLNLDKLTYAGSLDSLVEVEESNLYQFEHIDICNKEAVKRVLYRYKPDYIMHLAAETHVDNSIDDPENFIASNILGTYHLLEATREYWNDEVLTDKKKNSRFRFQHISTDEVFGDLELDEPAFTETSQYKPSSPYSASKASSDHLVNAWHRTFNLPIILTNCSNNYGPFQHPEKLIPTVISRALQGQKIPVYGSGEQIRDWLYVEDHADALVKVALNSSVGEHYNIGSEDQKTNIEMIKIICSLLEELNPNHPKDLLQYSDLISYVTDRPGHDFRYAINSQKIKQDLGWKPQNKFESGLRKTVVWYLNNQEWQEKILAKSKN
tara:strand:+ start:388 stop:1437 length:1050 start_codon:yes stop_codon:yes gene_type:complete